ncbi:MAG: hypothetical protein DMD91_19700 [Candidatus Rokuibacteriota bacterium]|nr:MAG: hypothetical protein DMD91_19700 [Candidatus Rokubacteria bacterium]
MSSNLGALLSATFYERGDEHLVEVIHQRDAARYRRLASLDIGVWDEAGTRLAAPAVDAGREILDVEALVAAVPGAPARVMVTFDARYDPAIFPYRPHHYAYLHRRGSPAPALYYAVNAGLGGVPDRIGATAINNFETYVFRRRPLAERYSLLLGCLSRWAPVEATITAHYGEARLAREVRLAPRAHVEVPLAAEHEGHRLARVELKALFRLVAYVVGRAEAGGELVLFDHLFTYFK